MKLRLFNDPALDETRMLLAGDAVFMVDDPNGGGGGNGDDPPGGDAGDDPDPGGADDPDNSALQGKLDKSVQAEKNLRKRLSDAEKELQELKDAGLSEKQKAEKERDEAKAEVDAARLELRSARGAVAAAKAGIRPSALKMAAAELPADLDFEDQDTVDKAMAQVAKDHPYLKGDGSVDGGTGGTRNGAPSGDMTAEIRRLAGRA